MGFSIEDEKEVCMNSDINSLNQQQLNFKSNNYNIALTPLEKATNSIFNKKEVLNLEPDEEKTQENTTIRFIGTGAQSTQYPEFQEEKSQEEDSFPIRFISRQGPYCKLSNMMNDLEINPHLNTPSLNEEQKTQDIEHMQNIQAIRNTSKQIPYENLQKNLKKASEFCDELSRLENTPKLKPPQIKNDDDNLEKIGQETEEIEDTFNNIAAIDQLFNELLDSDPESPTEVIDMLNRLMILFNTEMRKFCHFYAQSNEDYRHINVTEQSKALKSFTMVAIAAVSSVFHVVGGVAGFMPGNITKNLTNLCSGFAQTGSLVQRLGDYRLQEVQMQTNTRMQDASDRKRKQEEDYRQRQNKIEEIQRKADQLEKGRHETIEMMLR